MLCLLTIQVGNKQREKKNELYQLGKSRHVKRLSNKATKMESRELGHSTSCLSPSLHWLIVHPKHDRQNQVLTLFKVQLADTFPQVRQ